MHSIVLPDGRRLDDLKVSDLKKELELRGLSRSGIKKDLHARLTEALDNSASQSDHEILDTVESVESHISLTDCTLTQVPDATSEENMNKNVCIDKEVIEENFSNADDVIVNELDSKSIDNIPEKTGDIIECSSEVIDEFVSNEHEAVLENNDELKPSNIDLSSNRRRQWGSRNINCTVSLSSESLEKLLHTPASSVSLNETEHTDQSLNECSLNEQQKSEQVGNIDKEQTSIVDREIELDMDTVVGTIDVDEAIDTDKIGFDSRTVHLSSDFDANRITGNVDTDRDTTQVDCSLPVTDKVVTLQKQLSPVKSKGLKETKAVGYMIDPPERIEPSQPEKHVPTNIVYIKFLVRPFTAKQLRQMISSHYGNVTDLWLDKIKSTALVQMESFEEASKCRECLDGSRWPSMNPRVLRCEFAGHELFNWMKVNGDLPNVQIPKHLLLGTVETETSASINNAGKKADEHSTNNASGDVCRTLEHGREPGSQKTAVFDATAADIKTKNEEPAKLLNDLFRKTVAVPSIYWLPASTEQVNHDTAVVSVEKESSAKVSTENKPVPHQVRHKSRSPFANRPQDKINPSDHTSLTKSTNPSATFDSKQQQQQQGATTVTRPQSDNLSKVSNEASNVLIDSKRSSDLKLKPNDSSQRQTSGTNKGRETEAKLPTKVDHVKHLSVGKADAVSRKPSDRSPVGGEASKRQLTDVRTNSNNNNNRSIAPPKQPRRLSSPRRSKSPLSKRKATDSHNRSNYSRRRSSSSRSNSPVRRDSYKRQSYRYNSYRKDRFDRDFRYRQGDRRRSRSRSRSRSIHGRDRSSSGRYRSRR